MQKHRNQNLQNSYTNFLLFFLFKDQEEEKDFFFHSYDIKEPWHSLQLYRLYSNELIKQQATYQIIHSKTQSKKAHSFMRNYNTKYTNIQYFTKP